VFVGNVHVHDFGSLESGCRRRGRGMVRVCRYLKLDWVVKGWSAARCQGRDAFRRGRRTCVLAGKGAAEYFAHTLETYGGPFLWLGRGGCV